MKKIITRFPAWLLAFAVLVISLQTGGAYAAAPEVTGARIGISKGRTRFVLDVSRKINYKIFTLANPYRVVIDIDEVDWQIGPGGGRRAGGLLINIVMGFLRPEHRVLSLMSKNRLKSTNHLQSAAKAGNPFGLSLI